ncbi:MAG: 1,4-alpha-glucan branching enzyme, partial [Sulfuritalea sp.]|nr:1,4-alpha-glucan branching enzyme [Sulfuritalea sp.]
MKKVTPQKKETQGSSPAVLTDHDIFLFREGTHARLAEKLGAHRTSRDGQDGVHFAVWAPNAAAVTVKGDFNG